MKYTELISKNVYHDKNNKHVKIQCEFVEYDSNKESRYIEEYAMLYSVNDITETFHTTWTSDGLDAFIEVLNSNIGQIQIKNA